MSAFLQNQLLFHTTVTVLYHPESPAVRLVGSGYGSNSLCCCIEQDKPSSGCSVLPSTSLLFSLGISYSLGLLCPVWKHLPWFCLQAVQIKIWNAAFAVPYLRPISFSFFRVSVFSVQNLTLFCLNPVVSLSFKFKATVFESFLPQFSSIILCTFLHTSKMYFYVHETSYGCVSLKKSLKNLGLYFRQEGLRE